MIMKWLFEKSASRAELICSVTVAASFVEGQWSIFWVAVLITVAMAAVEVWWEGRQ